MKRLSFIQSLILVIIAFVVIDRAAAFVTAKVLERSGYRYAQLYASKIETDVAVIGNSRALRTINARQLSEALCRPTRNISAVGFGREAVETTSLDYIALNPKPKAVMLEASALLRTGNTMIWRLSPWRQDGTELDRRLTALEHNSVPWHTLIHVSRYNSDLFLKTLRYLGRAQDDHPNLIRSIVDDEAARNSAVWPERQKRAYKFLNEVDDAVASVTELAALLRAQGVELIVFLAPYHRLSPERQIVMPSFAEKLAASEGFTFYDGNAIYDDNQYFSDLVHLNVDGTVAYMDWFLQKPAVQALSKCEN